MFALIDRNAERWALLVFYTMLVVTMALEVIRREVFAYSSVWGEEMVRYSFIYLAWIGAAAAVRERAHIRIGVIFWGIFSGKLTPTEAGATAGIITILIGFVIGTLKLSDFPAMMVSSAKVNGVILPIIAFSLPFAQAMAARAVTLVFFMLLVALVIAYWPPGKLKDDIRYAHDCVRRFAEAQKATITDMAFEIARGLIAGQKAIPCQAAGCYAPGGRYAHIASALMTVTTPKVAGCGRIAACSPPRPGVGVHPAIIYTADLCGADRILALGGVQGVAAMAFGLFGLPKADILVGSGNQFVAEAKRILFGRVGIDMFAGPTDSLIIADETADAEIVAADLVGQAEHGYNSPVWLATTSRTLQYMKIVTWQRATAEGAKRVAQATARISRLEGMEGHARTADIRLAKYFPTENFDLSATEDAR